MITITAMGKVIRIEGEDKGGLLMLAADIAAHQAKLLEVSRGKDQNKES